MDELIERFKELVIKLISIKQDILLQGVTREDAFKWLETTESLAGRYYFQLARRERDPTFAMVTEEELKKTEDEIYLTLKLSVPLYIDKTVEDVAHAQLNSFHWMNAIDKNPFVGKQLEKLLEIA